LSFDTQAGIRDLPAVVNALSFGAKVRTSGNDRALWKLGLAGLEADGETHYAAMVTYQLRF